MWWRIFSLNDTPVSPISLVEHLHATGLPVEPHFRGDDLGWTSGTLVLPGGGTPIRLDRYLTETDGLRHDLNAFAAELETMDYSPNATALMQHVIQTKQLIAFRRPLDHSDEALLDRLCNEVTCFLASHSEGVYQADGLGWFGADGVQLVQEY